MKFLNTQVVFREIPYEVTLAINITGCPFTCEGCHSPELRKDIGTELTTETLDDLIKKNDGITCVCLMGGDKFIFEVEKICQNIKTTYNLKTAWYSGSNSMPHFEFPEFYSYFDYIKIGPYTASAGPLDSNTTNQRLFALHDITYKMQEKKYK